MRKLVVLGAAVLVGATSLLAGAAHAQTTQGEFNYSPEQQERGKPVQITGKCINGGSTDNVQMIVTARYGADGNEPSGYGFSKSFAPAADGTINGSVTVPDDAPFGDYVMGGACTAGPNVFFSKNGPFKVVLVATPTTLTPTTTRPTTTTSTSAPGATTTTEVGSSTGATSTTVLDATVEKEDNTTTTEVIDALAGTRAKDDDSIGPLLVMLGVIPLLAAVAAIALAMRRARGGTPTD